MTSNDTHLSSLRRLLRSPIHPPSTGAFDSHTATFNKATKVGGRVGVVRCADAGEVGRTILYAKEHNLSVSVKAGGHDISGFSVEGDIIIDLSLIDGIEVAPPASSSPNNKTEGQLPLSESAFYGEISLTPLEKERKGVKRAAGEAFEAEQFREEEGALQKKKDAGSDGIDPVDGGIKVETQTSVKVNADRETTDTLRLSGGGAATLPTIVIPDGVEPGENQNQEGRSDSNASDLSNTSTRATSQTNSNPVSSRSSSSDLRRPSGKETDFSDPNAFYYHQTQLGSFASRAHQSPGALPHASSPFTPPMGGFNLPALPPWLEKRDSGSAPASGPFWGVAKGKEREAERPAYMLVTIGAGCKGEDIDLKTSLYGYQVPMTIFPVGSAIFGNGGFGFLSRRYGLATDNVVEVEIVTAKGEILYLREDDESDEMKELWWAFRGAASTLGVATRYRVKAYPLRTCYSGDIVYPFNPLTTPSLITHWRDCLKGIKRELYSNITLTAGATPNQHVVVMQICWTGEREEGEKIVQSLTSWTGERSLFSNVSERYWLDQQDSVKRLLQPKSDHRWFIRADLVESLPDKMIYETVQRFKEVPERCAWLFETAGGAIGDMDGDRSCISQRARKCPFFVLTLHQWGNPLDDESWQQYGMRWMDLVVSPQSGGGPFPSFLGKFDPAEKVKQTFGGDEGWLRLQSLWERMGSWGKDGGTVFSKIRKDYQYNPHWEAVETLETHETGSHDKVDGIDGATA